MKVEKVKAWKRFFFFICIKARFFQASIDGLAIAEKSLVNSYPIEDFRDSIYRHIGHIRPKELLFSNFLTSAIDF